MERALTVVVWLDAFARCVREGDMTAARALFDPSVHAFGTRAELLDGIDDLLARQWHPVWPHTRGFRFLDAPLVTEAADDGSLVCVLTLWASEGVGPDGRTFARRGRCTIVLRATPDGWLAVHTHFSRTPDGGL
jgi:ketosteroid isomerase-like protein